MLKIKKESAADIVKLDSLVTSTE